MKVRLGRGGVALLLLVWAAGCGSGPAQSPVSGKVLYNGKAVTGGTMIFTPVAKGRPALANVNSDGTFALETNAPGDGAALGKYVIGYTPPQPELTEAQQKNRTYNPPPSPFAGLVPKEKEVEVKPGDNTIDVELVRNQ